MFFIRVERLINKPIEEVFGFLSDHENYCKFPQTDASELLEPGVTERNGLGALRKVVLGSYTLEERITAFERPNFLHYRIEKARPLPFRHDKGEITLSKEGDKTRVLWISEGHVNIPIFGNLVFDKMAETQGAAGMIEALEWIDEQRSCSGER